MRNLFLLVAALVSFSIASLAQVNVTVSSPQASSTVGSQSVQFNVSATTTSGRWISGWRIYVDSQSVFSAGATPSISPTVNMAVGSHYVIVRAWDTSGAYGSSTFTLTVDPGSPVASGVTVNLTSPTSSTVGGTVNFAGTASSSNPITGWAIYVDGGTVFVSGGSTLNHTVSLSQGMHSVTVRAWDSSGAFGSDNLSLNVTQSSPLPTPPSNAVTFNVDDRSSSTWGNCGYKACAGGADTTNYWMAPYQSSPSQDGASTQFVVGDGVPWANVLWWTKFQAQSWTTNMIWDFWTYLSDTSLRGAEALEYDMFWAQYGYNFMAGTECNYGLGVWDIWDEVAGHWVHTNDLGYNVPCKKLAANAWHHIQWYVTRDPNAKSYTFRTLVVDGAVYSMNITRYAKNLGWGDTLGVQVQQDVNGTAQGYHQWMDKSTVIVW